jgi:hypothetical protein
LDGSGKLSSFFFVRPAGRNRLGVKVPYGLLSPLLSNILLDELYDPDVRLVVTHGAGRAF